MKPSNCRKCIRRGYYSQKPTRVNGNNRMYDGNVTYDGFTVEEKQTYDYEVRTK